MYIIYNIHCKYKVRHSEGQIGKLDRRTDASEKIGEQHRNVPMSNRDHTHLEIFMDIYPIIQLIKCPRNYIV